MTPEDKLITAIVRQASFDLYRLWHKHRTTKENKDLDELINWFNDMGLDYIANEIIINGKKPMANTLNPLHMYQTTSRDTNPTRVQTQLNKRKHNNSYSITGIKPVKASDLKIW